MSARRRHRRIEWSVLGISCAGWVALLVADNTPILPRLCSASGWSVAAHAEAAVRFNPIGPLLVAYIAMLAAMMVPLLSVPLREVSDRSTALLRLPAMVGFSIGYTLPWVMAAPIFGLAITWLETAPSPGANWDSIVPIVLAFGWHMTPMRQYALNRCHRRLTGFVSYHGGFWRIAVEGAQHGIACLTACAPLMLLAMTQPHWHLPSMALVATFLWIERRMPPERLRWGPCNIQRTVKRFDYFIRRSLAAAIGRKVYG